MNLDLIERRGRLSYIIGTDVHTVDGHFRLSLDHQTIEARKVRGRNRWRLCSRSAVVMFTEIREWEK
jgi:hypothetical protein